MIKVFDQLKNLPREEQIKFDYKAPPQDPKVKTIEHRSKRKLIR
jgi:hypothetical protein